MNFRLVMDRGNILGSLFGGAVSFRRIWMRAQVQQRGSDAAAVEIQFSGWGKAVDDEARTAYAAQIQRFEQESEDLAEKLAAAGEAEPAVVREVVIKEVVRIPCKFCGSLVDNTARKCLECGAPLT